MKKFFVINLFNNSLIISHLYINNRISTLNLIKFCKINRNQIDIYEICKWIKMDFM